MKSSYSLICSLALFVSIIGCNNDDDNPQPESVLTVKSDAKEILTFQFLLSENPITANVIGEIDQDMHTIFAILPGNSLKTALLPQVTTSANARVSPVGVQDFSEPVTYTVIAEDSSQQVYEVSIVTEKEALVAIDAANPSNSLGWDLGDPDLSNWEGVTLNNGVIVDLLIHNSLLTSIPSEIGYLRNLLYLGTHMNDYSSIPPEIGELTNLERLSVGSNSRLNSVPPEIGLLRNLKIFHLDNNPSLNSLPREIGQLTSLTNLYINGNGHTTIPQEICDLETEHGTDIFMEADITCN